MNKLLLLLLLVTITSSCYTHRGLSRNSDYQPDLFYKENLNGIYENAIPEDPDNSLWQDLYKHESAREMVFNPAGTQVELIMLSDKEVQANLYRHGGIEDSIKLKGKVKGKYFVVNRRFTIIPIPLLWFFSENKTILGNDDQGNLILSQGNRHEFALFFTLFGGDHDEISARYSKL